MSRRILIFSGGSLNPSMTHHVREDDYIIGADRGALFVLEQGVRLDVALGDFDSVTQDQMERIQEQSAAFISCDPIMKDMTDTEMALDYALKQAPAEILLFGALGSRADHSLANIQLLKRSLDQGIPCTIVDENNRLRLISPRAPERLESSPYTHVSLLPLSEVVTGIHLEGFMYPLEDATIPLGSSLGISNKLLADYGLIQIKTGLLLVIESKD